MILEHLKMLSDSSFINSLSSSICCECWHHLSIAVSPFFMLCNFSLWAYLQWEIVSMGACNTQFRACLCQNHSCFIISIPLFMGFLAHAFVLHNKCESEPHTTHDMDSDFSRMSSLPTISRILVISQVGEWCVFSHFSKMESHFLAQVYTQGKDSHILALTFRKACKVWLPFLTDHYNPHP